MHFHGVESSRLNGNKIANARSWPCTFCRVPSERRDATRRTRHETKIKHRPTCREKPDEIRNRLITFGARRIGRVGQADCPEVAAGKEVR